MAKPARADLDDSLEKLRTDHFDIYQLHGLMNVEEAGTSDGGATTDGGRAGGDNYGSDDEANGMLLQQIQGKILGVLKLDAAEAANKP